MLTDRRLTVPQVGAVIVAAGRSSRMGGVDKLFAPLGGRPLLTYALAVFEACALIDRIVLVTAADRVESARAALEPFQLKKLEGICAGGERRQDSVRAGLEALGRVDTVVIHDAARPLVTAEIIERGLEVVRETGAAIAAVPAVDTFKEADSDGTVLRTIPRERLWAVQTPQVFDFELLLRAHLQSPGDVTDDAMLIEALGHTVKLFLGSPRNLKVTGPDDLLLAEALLRLDNG
ncbi:MAG: 2-C-methyl-D-erythritol 4-phosphate cytidylyltransferase [Dehalococcoidia bacterium]